MDKVLRITILLLSFVAMWGILRISIEEWATGEGCPKLATIPICYIITVLVAILIFAQFTSFRYKLRLFLLGAGIPWAIAIIASYMQYNGITECPKSKGGTPMLSISFAI